MNAIKRKVLLAIEGNIGAGKSFILSAIKSKLKGKPNYLFIDEPVEQFSCALLNGSVYNPLGAFYNDPVRHAFSSQVWIYECYKRQHEALSKQSTHDTTIIMDRGVYSTIMFVEVLRNQGFLTDFEADYMRDKTKELLNLYFGDESFGCDKLYYLDTPIPLCVERIASRDRCEEKRLKDMGNYLEMLDASYRAYIHDFAQTSGRDNAVVFHSEDLSETIDRIMCLL